VSLEIVLELKQFNKDYFCWISWLYIYCHHVFLERAGKVAPKRPCSKNPHLVQIAVKCLQIPRLKQGQRAVMCTVVTQKL